MTANPTEDRHHTLRWAVIVVGSLLAVVVFLGFLFTYNNRPPHIAIPTTTMPVPNGYDDFLQAAKIMGAAHHWGPVSDPDPRHVWTMPEYESFMHDNALATSTLRAGLKKQCLIPPARGNLFDLLPTFARFREMARMLSSEAMYYEKIGECGKAVDAQLDCLEFGVALQKGGDLTPALVSSAIVSIGLPNLEPRLRKLNSEQRAHAASRLEVMRKRIAPYSDILNEEAWSHVSMYQSSLGDPSTMKQICDPRTWTKPNPFVWSGPTGSKWQNFQQNAKFAFANKTTMLRDNLQYVQALAKEQRGHYTGRSSVPIPANLIAQQSFHELDLLGKVRGVFSRDEARLALLQTEIALLRYHADHGKYPDRLDDLKPAYLKSIPEDPFGLGKPLRYRSVNSGTDFLLYSLGPNLKDDGGKPGKWDGAKARGDLVAGKL